MSKFVINIDNGRIAFRDEHTDRQINMKPIPDTVAAMITSGEVTPDDVVKAVNARIRESGEYDDVEKYLKERAKLNVRKSNPQKLVKREELSDRSSEEVSVQDVLAMKGGADTKGERRVRAKKLDDAMDTEQAPRAKVNL